MCKENDLPEPVPPTPYVVLDLEMCNVNRTMARQYGLKNEIIQVGAVLLDQGFEKAGEFNRYVKPVYGRIDGFIHKLTGIDVSDVSDAEDLETVLREFLSWMPEDAVIVSWSMSDRGQLFGEMRAKGICFEELDRRYESWVDCQQIFGERINVSRCYSLEEALVAADIVTDGRAHNGLADAYNTALLYAKLSTEQEFQMNPYYRQAREAKHDSHLNYSIGDLLSGMDLVPDEQVRMDG